MKAFKSFLLTLLLTQGFLLAQNPLSILSTGINNVKCNGGVSGSLSIQASGGQTPYTYSINGGGTFQPSAQFNNLAAGTYQVVVRDAAGTLAGPEAVTVTQPAKLTATRTSTEVSCFGVKDGTITITPVGGVPPYQFSINNGATYQPSNIFTGLASSSSYIVRVRDANLCLSPIVGATVSTPGAILLNFTAVDPTCNSYTDGRINLSATGGRHGFVYSIDNGQTFFPSQNFPNLGAGTYQVTCKDAVAGCPGPVKTVVLREPEVLTVDVQVPQQPNGYAVSCFNGADGSATAIAAGGTMPYNYRWSNGQTTATITQLPVGSYTTTVTDSKGCSASKGTSLSSGPAFTVTTPPCTPVIYGYASRACATLSPTVSGSGPYSYYWSTGQRSSTISVCPTVTTVYGVTVSDVNGCAVASAFSVPVTDARCGNNPNNPKVAVCHIPPGNTSNPQDICIANEAVPAHLTGGPGHNNCTLGPCGNDPCNPGAARRTSSSAGSSSGVNFNNSSLFTEGTPLTKMGDSNTPMVTAPTPDIGPKLHVNFLPEVRRLDIVMTCVDCKDKSPFNVSVTEQEGGKEIYRGTINLDQTKGKGMVSVQLPQSSPITAWTVKAVRGSETVQKRINGGKAALKK